MGTAGEDTRSFSIALVAYSPEGLDAFPNSGISQNGWIRNFWFDWLVADDFPFIRHLNHGWQYVIYVPDELLTGYEYYLYDYKLGSWLYTTPALYPNLSSYGLGTWLYYIEGTGNGFDEDRTFYNFATGEDITG